MFEVIKCNEQMEWLKLCDETHNKINKKYWKIGIMPVYKKANKRNLPNAVFIEIVDRKLKNKLDRRRKNRNTNLEKEGVHKI